MQCEKAPLTANCAPSSPPLLTAKRQVGCDCGMKESASFVLHEIDFARVLQAHWAQHCCAVSLSSACHSISRRTLAHCGAADVATATSDCGAVFCRLRMRACSKLRAPTIDPWSRLEDSRCVAAFCTLCHASATGRRDICGSSMLPSAEHSICEGFVRCVFNVLSVAVTAHVWVGHLCMCTHLRVHAGFAGWFDAIAR